MVMVHVYEVIIAREIFLVCHMLIENFALIIKKQALQTTDYCSLAFYVVLPGDRLLEFGNNSTMMCCAAYRGGSPPCTVSDFCYVLYGILLLQSPHYSIHAVTAVICNE